MMRALIVDDEIYAREEMESLLKETGEFTVAGNAPMRLEAMQAINQERPDVLFLDVQMPVINGFELLGMIDDGRPCRGSFSSPPMTNMPSRPSRRMPWTTCSSRSKRRGSRRPLRSSRRIGDGSKPVFAGPDIQKIPCIHASKIKLINTAEIEYVRSGETGVHVICRHGEFYTDLTLQVLENKTKLVRCHKQILINIDLVDEIILRENLAADIKTKSGRLVPVSRRYLKILREKLHF